MVRALSGRHLSTSSGASSVSSSSQSPAAAAPFPQSTAAVHPFSQAPVAGPSSCQAPETAPAFNSEIPQAVASSIASHAPAEGTFDFVPPPTFPSYSSSSYLGGTSSSPSASLPVVLPSLSPAHPLISSQTSPVTETPSESGSSFELLNIPDFSQLSLPDTSLSDEKENDRVTNNRIILSPDHSSSDQMQTLRKENLELIACLEETNILLAKLEKQHYYYRKSLQESKVKKDAEGEINGTIEESSLKENKKASKKDKKSDKKNGLDKIVKNGVSHDAQFQTVQIQNLSSQLDIAEDSQAQLSQDLQRVTEEKLEAQNQAALLGSEVERLKGLSEQLNKEKWELSAVNNDLQQRLQQTVALAHMQAEGNQSRLQEEVGRMLMQLEEERKVTANLSRNLELERRKVESLEQKAKSAGSSTRGSTKGDKRRSSLVPEEVMEGELRLAQSMELYRQRCDNLGLSLAGCQQNLTDAHFQGDLVTEVAKLRKLLEQEKKKSHGESSKLTDAHQLFEQVYLDYSSVVESVKKSKSAGGAVLEDIAESNMRDNVDRMTARLMQAEEALTQELARHQDTKERLNQVSLDVEALPLLRAQVEVYQSDFNAERAARERIAGEKADLEEQLRQHKAGAAPGPLRTQAEQPRELPPRQELRQEVPPRPDLRGDLPLTSVRNRVNSYGRRQDVEQAFDHIPTTVNTRPVPAGEQAGPDTNFPCPKCNREFRNTTLLTRHVNECLDRDY